MSLIVTLYVREGIVMASDSRISYNSSSKEGGRTVNYFSVGVTDSVYKTFLAPGNIGISTFGEADIKGVPIAGYIESFINEQLAKHEVSVDEVPELLIKYFAELPYNPSTEFVVAGYKEQQNKPVQQVWHVNVKDKQRTLVNPPDQPGAFWGGEADIMTRLIKALWEEDRYGQQQQLPFYPILWMFFTLQDAIDFAVYAIRTTIDSIRFQSRPKTVGGPIDVLVIKPDGAFWVNRKELRV